MIYNRKIITSSSFLAMLFLGVGYSLVGAAARNIGVTPAQIGLLLAAQNVGFGVAVAIAGALSDTQPKPRILLIGSILLAAGLLGFSCRTHLLGQPAGRDADRIGDWRL